LITDYLITYQEDNIIEFRITYNVHGATEKITPVGNGSIGDNNWINGKCQFIVIKVFDSTIEVTNAGTSPYYLTEIPIN
jgi:hypothetical protein